MQLRSPIRWPSALLTSFYTNHRRSSQSSKCDMANRLELYSKEEVKENVSCFYFLLCLENHEWFIFLAGFNISASENLKITKNPFFLAFVWQKLPCSAATVTFRANFTFSVKWNFIPCCNSEVIPESNLKISGLFWNFESKLHIALSCFSRAMSFCTKCMWCFYIKNLRSRRLWFFNSSLSSSSLTVTHNAFR